jgi:hypothetical protein
LNRERCFGRLRPRATPRHPTVIKRSVIQDKDGAVFIRMNALRGAAKDECDKLIAQFKQLNEDLKKDLQSGTRRTFYAIWIRIPV